MILDYVDGYFWLKAKIMNPHPESTPKPLSFIVDTGTQASCLPAHLIESLSLEPFTEEIEITYADQESGTKSALYALKIDITFDYIKKIIEAGNRPFVSNTILPTYLGVWKNPGLQNYGLLGLDFLNNFHFSCSPAEKKAYLAIP